MGVPIEGEVNKVFFREAKPCSGNAGCRRSKTLRRTLYFMGVPIESEVNKVILGRANPSSAMQNVVV